MPYPAISPSAERLTVAREAPQRTGVPSIRRNGSCQVGIWRAIHNAAADICGPRPRSLPVVDGLGRQT